MNKTEFKKLMRLQHGFTAREAQVKKVFGFSNNKVAYSTITVMESEKNYLIFCDIENEFRKVYHNFGETAIEINKDNNDFKMVFTVSDEDGTFVVESNDIKDILFSSYFSDNSKEYTKKLCNLIFEINKEKQQWQNRK